MQAPTLQQSVKYADKRKANISQAMFDQIVSENVEDFEMTIEEALEDAVSQCGGADLSDCITTAAGRALSAKVREQMVAANAAIESGLAAGVALALHALRGTCALDKEQLGVAADNGALGAATIACKKFPESKEAAVAGLELLSVLARTKRNRMAIPDAGLEAVVDYLMANPGDAEIQRAGMRALAHAMTEDECNKVVVHKRGFNQVLIAAMEAHPGSVPAFSAMLAAMRKYLADDDRGKDVHPDTFLRSRLLAENKKTGMSAKSPTGETSPRSRPISATSPARFPSVAS